MRYPIGNQDFESLRKDGFVYIDKTRFVYELSRGSKYIFLSRPRRFGKSLLLSTIKAYFKGKKELFEGLEIAQLEHDWKSHPVLHLSFANFDGNNPNSLVSILENQFQKWEKAFGIDNTDFGLAQRFQNIIEGAFHRTGERVVVLVDEYDHALINLIDKEEDYKANRELLKAVYSNLKEMDAYLRFAILTGVTRFSKSGIFSGLNNLNDISFSEKYSAICGFTEKEIKTHLWTGVEKISLKEDKTPEEALDLLKSRYDGYHFSEDLLDIYNPFSLLNALDKENVENYWISSGTPSFLIKKLETSRYAFAEVFQSEADTYDLAAVDTAFTSPVALLYQTGYLTIKEYDKETKLYRLGIPNKEVRESLIVRNLLKRDKKRGVFLSGFEED